MKIHQEKIADGTKYVWDISFHAALQCMRRSDIDFMCTLFNILRQFDAPTYFWECVPVDSKSIHHKPFEFVLISADIPRYADPSAFQQHFSDHCSVVSFLSLHKDTLLIVPCPKKKMSADYSSLGTYIRQNNQVMLMQCLDLFKIVGEQMDALLHKKKRIWLNTHGLGISWLHIRLDTKPKYYLYKPYKI